jgi:hypothetical protein
MLQRLLLLRLAVLKCFCITVVHNSVLCPPCCYYRMHNSVLYNVYNLCVYSAVLCPNYCSAHNPALCPHHYYYCMHSSVLYLFIIVLCTIKYCTLTIIYVQELCVGLLEAVFCSFVTFLMTRTAYFMFKYIFIHVAHHCSVCYNLNCSTWGTSPFDWCRIPCFISGWVFLTIEAHHTQENVGLSLSLGSCLS